MVVLFLLCSYLGFVEPMGILYFNTYLDANILARYDLIGVRGCARQCLRYSANCLSFNIQRKTLSCELLSQTASQVTNKTLNRDGAIYSEISSWNTELAGGCMGANCSSGEQCFELKSGRTVCENIRVVCRPGMFLDGTSCRQCSVGFFSNLTNQLNCTSCSSGQYQNKEGQTSCLVCPEHQYQDLNGQSDCKICISGNGSEWRKVNDQKTACVGCWKGIGTYTEGDNTKVISKTSVPDRAACYLKCHLNSNCQAIKATKQNKECTMFSSRTWKYGYVLDSVVVIIRTHCLSGR